MTTPIRMKPATVARPREGQSCPQSPSPSLTQYAAGALLGILAAGAVFAAGEAIHHSGGNPFEVAQ